jgi:hypothetical protein
MGNGKAVRNFIERVDFLIEYFEWDETLPEFAELKGKASDHLHNPMIVLRELDPHHSATTMADGSVVIFERPFGGTIRTEHIAERLVGQLNELAGKIVANKQGTTVYDRHGGKLVTFQAGSIDPFRLGDTGNRYRNAAYVIERYSGQQFDGNSLVQRVHTITVTLQGDGTWSEPQFEYVEGREPVKM